MASPVYLLFILFGSIVFIVWATAYRKLDAFFALLLAAVGVGVLSGMPLLEILNVLKTGFGNTMGKIGLLIIFGTSLGIVLEKTGATMSMANSVLRLVRQRNAPAAISLTGFIIGLPIFCDSGFIILNGLNHSLVRKTRFSMAVMASALATALYSVHCLVPPHPGITAAVSSMDGDIGKVMVWGIALAVPGAVTGYLWSRWMGSKIPASQTDGEVQTASAENLPPVYLSFMPVVLPVLLIALKSVLLLLFTGEQMSNPLIRLTSFTGDPVVAIGFGLIFSLLLIQRDHRANISGWLTEGISKAGVILAIIAAGGMLGEILHSSGVSANLGQLLRGFSLGIFLPFLITAVLKTAQGSSTVAIITASSLVMPLLPELELTSPHALTMTILSMGAGSMMVSHANDSYFWVISRFSGLDTASALKVFTIATALMAITIQLIIWLLLVIF